jgi:hypothetical protein
MSRETPEPRQAVVRRWTVDEANARLPQLDETLPQLRVMVERLRAVHEEIHRLAEFWGAEIDSPDLPDREHKDRLDQEWRRLTQRIEDQVTALRDEGIEIKDLEGGLIDFYGTIDGELVFLCWQRGEDRVAYYHTLAGGYRTRRPIDKSSRRPTFDPRGAH